MSYSFTNATDVDVYAADEYGIVKKWGPKETISGLSAYFFNYTIEVTSDPILVSPDTPPTEIPVSKVDRPYDNSQSGLSGRTVQAAIDETVSDVDEIEEDVSSLLIPNFKRLSSVQHGVTSGSKCTDVYVDGNYAYLTLLSTPGFLVSYDVTDPENPVVLDWVTLYNFSVNGPTSVVAKGGYVYVGMNSGHIVVVDASDPSNLSVLKVFYKGGSQTYGMAISDDGNYLFSPDTAGGFYAIDVTDKSSPSVIYHDGGFVAAGAAFENGYVYISDYSSSAVRIYDATSLPTITHDNTFSVGNNPAGIAAYNDALYVGNYASPNQINIVDISDPTSPSLLSTLDAGGLVVSQDAGLAVSESDDLLYVSVVNEDVYGNGAIKIFDVSDKSNPRATNITHWFPGVVKGNDLSEGYLYVADYGRNALTILSGIKEDLTAFSFLLGGQGSRVPISSTRPPNPRPGQQIIDSDDNKLLWWDGSNWRDALGTIVP